MIMTLITMLAMTKTIAFFAILAAITNSIGIMGGIVL